MDLKIPKKDNSKSLSKSMEKAMNDQLKVELESSHLYYCMHSWFEWKGYFGASKLFKAYSDEEKGHADKVMSFMIGMGVLPTVPPVNVLPHNMESFESIIEQGLKHELFVTSTYENLHQLADAEGDGLTCTFALAMLKEQVEEEGKMRNWIDRLKICPSPYFVDKEMG